MLMHTIKSAALEYKFISCIAFTKYKIVLLMIHPLLFLTSIEQNPKSKYQNQSAIIKFFTIRDLMHCNPKWASELGWQWVKTWSAELSQDVTRIEISSHQKWRKLFAANFHPFILDCVSFSCCFRLRTKIASLSMSSISHIQIYQTLTEPKAA